MFSSSNNGIGSYSPYFPLSTSFFGHETLLVPPNPSFLQNDFSSFMEPVSNGFVKHFSPSYEKDLVNEIPKKKKDMHRKIITARGPRERRVRLSIDVAQKFFDLQDMLGFDKASKTLDWLLGKSNSAIEELKKVSDEYVINNNSDCEKSVYCTYDFEVLSDQTNENSKISNVNSDFTRDKRLSRSSFQLVGRESRSKARERARKRTKEKMVASRACDIMHLGTSCPIINQNEAPSYSETMMVNCSTNEQDACFKVSQEQRTCEIEDSFSINESSMKPFSILSTASSSINYRNWANIGMLAPQSQLFSYLQSAHLETEFQDR